MNLDQKLLKKLEDDSYNMIQMNKETIAKIIATFEGAIKDLDETPKDACILTCGYFRPSIYTFRLLNEYQSTKKVLLTYKKNGIDLKLITNPDSRKLHDDFSNIDIKTPAEFESHCKQKIKERVLDIKKLHSIIFSSYVKNAKSNDYLVSL